MTQLIIAEKPAAAGRIAYSLSESKPKTDKKYNVRYYKIERKNNEILIAPSVGHIFSLSQKSASKGYPVLDPEWKPSWEVSKSSKYTKKYGKLIKSLAKEADEVIVATDFDREGSVIGYNCVRFLTGRDDAKRMKFSTLTASELKSAYKNRLDSLDWGQVNSGTTRHRLDFLWGVSLSKAAMSAVSKAINKFVTLSIGRVQGPALSILTKKEKEIEKFEPKDYWQIFARIKLKTGKFKAIHKKKRFWKKNKAEEIYKKVKDKDAEISKLKRKKKKVYPPYPFDLTSLQMEAYRKLKIPPKQTLSIAQKLYTKALISYPRTSSQKLPHKLGFKKILKKLSKNSKYKKTAHEVLKTSLKPHQGKKKDPAHPAIYPTGKLAKNLKGRQKSLYDLVVKRFFAVFGKKGEVESTKATFEVKGESFILKGQKITKKGWILWYSPYYKSRKNRLPSLKEGEKYPQKTKIKKKKTKPPKRYSQASIIKKLEKNKLGTKATRANIIDTLYKRNYISGRSIKVSKLGKEIVKTFSKYAPEILSKDLTSNFEEQMEEIRKGNTKKEKVIDEAKKLLTKICKEFDKHKKEIGKSIGEAAVETRKKSNRIMPCPKCEKGYLRIIRSKKTGKRFLACNQYPNCKFTWPLPQKGLIKTTKKKCKECKTPLIAVYKKGKRPWILCPNPKCPSKEKNE